MKVIEKVSSRETIFNLMPSSDNFDYQAFVTKIKRSQKQLKEGKSTIITTDQLDDFLGI